MVFKMTSETNTFWPEADFLAGQLKTVFLYLDQLGAPGLAKDKPGALAPVVNTPPISSKKFRTMPSSAVEGSKLVAAEKNFISSAKDLKTLEDAAASCQLCSLCRDRKSVIFGYGALKPKIVVVENFPHESDETSGQAPSGLARELLEAILEKGLQVNKSEYYVTCAVKCRPQNNGPKKETIVACRQILKAQLTFLQPKMVLALGQMPAESLAQSKLPFGIFRKKTHEVAGLPGLYLRTTFSLDDILSDDSLKKEAWHDLKPIVAFLKK